MGVDFVPSLVVTTRPEHRPVGFFALRSPLLAVDEVVDLDPAGPPDLRARLPRLLKAPEVREAVFLASPQLEAALDGWLAAADEDGSEPRNPDDLTLALARYVTRMATRATPFGLFAAHATGLVAGRDDLARPTRLELPALGRYRRHSRPDSHLLHTVMADATRGGLAAEQAVIVNQSAYRVEGRLRFVDLEGTAGYLVLSDVWFPGWTCRVDGTEVEVLRANHAFRAVPVPTGAKRAEFVFAPRSYRVGWWVSAAAVALLAIAGAVGVARRLRRTSPVRG